MKINPSHMDEEGVRDRIKSQHRKNMRESDTRRQFLQKYARIISGVTDSRLQFGNMACVTMEEGNPIITIPSNEFDQPVTEYDQDIFDLMIQESLTVHEILHIIYTNYRSFKRYLNKCSGDNKYLFKEIWNCLEDGAIEQQGRYAMSIADELEVMNANFVENIIFGTEQSNGDIVYTMHEAVTTALTDLAIFDSGNYTKILDPSQSHRLSTPHDQELFEDFLPEIKSVVKDVLTQPSSKKRNARVYSFYEKYMDMCDDAHIDGRSQRIDENMSGGGGESTHTIELKPDDTQGHTGVEQKDAYMLGSPDQEEEIDEQIDIDGSIGDGGEEGEEGDNSPLGGGQQEEQEQENEEHGTDVDTKNDLEEDYEQELEDEWFQHATSNDGVQQEIEEAVEFLDAIDRGTGSSNSDWRPNQVELEIPEPSGEFDNSRYTEASRKAKQLENILRARLQSEKRTKNKTNLRRGKFDSNRMVAASMGGTRVFEKEVELDKKDYDCVVVYDRSGSMNGQDKDLEIAGGMLAMALNSVGVETSIMGLYRGEARLELPFGAPVSTKKENLFAGDISGGTPLSKAIFLARHRLMERNTNPFMIVITDGRPDNQDRYKEELMKCNFPVVGIYLNTSMNANEMTEYFHRVSNVNGDNITLEIKRLVQQIMF